MFSGETNHISPSGNMMKQSAFGGCQENITCLTALLYVGIFLGKLDASSYQDILDSPPKFVGTYWGWALMLQRDCTPVQKSSSIKTWVGGFGVEELNWHAQSPDFIRLNIA